MKISRLQLGERERETRHSLARKRLSLLVKLTWPNFNAEFDFVSNMLTNYRRLVSSPNIPFCVRQQKSKEVAPGVQLQIGLCA